MKSISIEALGMEKVPEDEILSKRNFQKSSGINLDNFMIQSAFEDEVAEESETVSEEQVDEAVGEVAEIFSRGDLPSNINRDGTVNVLFKLSVLIILLNHIVKKFYRI